MKKKYEALVSNEDSGESLMAQLLEKYGSYWPLFAFIIVVFIGLAFLYLKISSPMYEATATIMVKDEKKGSEDTRMMEAFSAVGSKKLIENEMEVIQSEPVIRNVVHRMNLSVELFKVNRFKRFLLYENAPVVTELVDHIKISNTPFIPLEYRPSRKKFLLDNRHWIEPNKLCQTPHAAICLRIKDSNILYHDSISYLLRFKSMDLAIQDVLKNLKVSFSNKQSSIIRLTYQDESPLRAKDILHHIIQSYEDKVMEEKRNLAQSTIQLIDRRLQAVSKNIDSIEGAVENFKAKYDASDLENQGKAYLMGIESNNEELTRVEMQLAVADQLAKALEQDNGSNNTVMMSTMGVSDPNLNKLMADLNNKQLEYDRLKKTVPENNPMLLSLREQINRLKPDIRINVNTMQRNLRASRDHLTGSRQRYQSQLQVIPLKERKVLELSRNKTVNDEMYAYLLQKREETELSYASTLTPFQIINDASTSFRKVSPNTVLTYLTAVLLAVFLGFSVVFSREHLNPRILFRDELENMTDVPVLGEISKRKLTNDISIDFALRSKEAEEFRRLRLALRNRNQPDEIKKLLVTSSIPGEGKSYVAWNMALCLAASGQKILLVDADIYQSGINEIMPELKDSKGLTELIAENIDPTKYIISSTRYQGLSILPAGKKKVHDMETLLGEPFSQLLDKYGKSYDMIIVDTPPSFLLTDAHRVSGYCNSVLYVVRHNYTPKRILRRLDQTLDIHPLKNAFLVFNGIGKRGFASYGYGYGYHENKYSSKYGYG